MRAALSILLLVGLRGNLGISKSRKSYEYGDLIRRSDLKCFSLNSNIIEFSCISLKELIKINKLTYFFNERLIQIVADPELLILSYVIIKSDFRNFTFSRRFVDLESININ